MMFSRVLLVTAYGGDVRAALGAVRALAPQAERLIVMASPAGRGSAVRESSAAWVDALRREAKTCAAEADVLIVRDVDAEALEAVVAESAIDLVVIGAISSLPFGELAEVRKRRPIALLWLGTALPLAADRRPIRVFSVALGARAQSAVAAFLRDHGSPDVDVTLCTLAGLPPRELDAALAVTGICAAVKMTRLPPWRALQQMQEEGAIDLVLLPYFPRLFAARLQHAAPVLVLPRAEPGGPAMQRPIDVPDVVDDRGVLRVRLGYAFGVGRNPPIEDQEIAFVCGGLVEAVLSTRNGEAELQAPRGAVQVGVFRVQGREGLDPVAAIERAVAVVRPGSKPLVLFDAELPAPALSAMAQEAGVDLLAVRVRRVRSCHLLRERLRSAGLAPLVADASAVLGEGDAADVSAAMDAVRLARVGARMREAGYPVAAIVCGGPQAPAANGFAALLPHEIGGAWWKRALAEHVLQPAGADAAGGNRVEIELDNATARRWLLDAIAGASRRVHLQTYMATDDELGRCVEAALREAARRGVAVRVLIDSLHGGHGSWGMRNPLIERLLTEPAVEVRLSRPLTGIPSLEDLKQRDHRKLLVADGRVALLGGRNLAHEYYTAFDEVRITPASPWREVPWLDAGARIEGPAVATIDGSFRDAWIEAGGEPFDIVEAPVAGATNARVVVHRGLRDANTLEAYLALIEGARSHIDVVTGFPLLLEIQHALLRALRRGVRVRTVFGHVAPTHGDQPFEGDLARARLAATSLVHSRMDALVAAGALGYHFAVREVSGWARELGIVRPHVHAKSMSADAERCAVGSANLDVTGCYWESEILLVVEDASVARQYEACVDRLVEGSVPVDRKDSEWQRVARRREWMRNWPGVLSM